MTARIIKKTLFCICLVFVGIVFGIWLDWHAWLSHGIRRDLYFEVQNYNLANLVVHGNDTIHLVRSKGGSNGLQMNFFQGVKPCVGPDGADFCQIDPNASPGPYFFSCGSTNDHYNCPDPGVQQSSVPGGTVPSFKTALESDLLGQNTGTDFNMSNPTNANQPAPNSVTEYVVCNDKKLTDVDPLPGSPGTPNNIQAAQGQTVFWINPTPFTLDLTQSPGLCKATPGSPTTEAQCDLAVGPGTYKYTAKSSDTKCAQSAPTAQVLTVVAATK